MHANLAMMYGMNPSPLLRAVFSIVLVLACTMAGCTAPRTRSTAPTTQAAVPQPQEVSLPGIVVVPATGEVRVEGQTCLEQGILEYIAVATGGKAYESLFVLECRPSHLQVAMMMAGHQQGELPRPLHGDFAPGSRPAARPAGAPTVTSPPSQPTTQPAAEPTTVTIDVDVRQDDGSWQRRGIESLLLDRRTGQAPARLTWAFTGSFFHRDRRTRMEFYVADAERSVVALWYDPTALFNVTQDVGNPYRGVTGLAINPAGVPKRGTPVRLVLHPAASRPTP